MEVQNMFKKFLILCVLSSFLVYAQDRTPEETLDALKNLNSLKEQGLLNEVQYEELVRTLMNDSDTASDTTKNSDLNSNTNTNNKRRPSEITLHNANIDSDEELLTAIENLLQDDWESVGLSRNTMVLTARGLNWMLNTEDFKKAQTDEDLLEALKNMDIAIYRVSEYVASEAVQDEIKQYGRDRVLYVAQRLQKGFDFSPYAFQIRNDSGYLVVDLINEPASDAYYLATFLERAERYEEAIDWYQKSIEWGDDNYVSLVFLYQELGDHDNAYKWLMKGVAEDSTGAKCELGYWYFNGEISPYISRNRTKAYDLRDEVRERTNSNLCGDAWITAEWLFGN